RSFGTSHPLLRNSIDNLLFLMLSRIMYTIGKPLPLGQNPNLNLNCSEDFSFDTSPAAETAGPQFVVGAEIVPLGISLSTTPRFTLSGRYFAFVLVQDNNDKLILARFQFY